MAIKLSRLVRFLDDAYPFILAEEWDNVGLIFGDPAAKIERVLLALDLTADVAAEAADIGAGAVITHHPPIFKAIKRIDLSVNQGHVIGHCLKHGIASIALHTNLDSARGGLNDHVAEMLGLSGLAPLADAPRGRLLKLVVYVPRTHAEKVRDALFAAGAGHVGEYDRCSFNLEGIGTFRGGDGTKPAIGKPGSFENVQELRIEVLLPRERMGSALGAMIQAHPYEEVAYDLIPLDNRDPTVGLGRIGELPEPLTLRAFADKVAGLDMMVLRTLGDRAREVRKVALCTGAGGDFTSRAASAGADVYLTAEVHHHHALEADFRGMCVVETDHYSLERVFWPRLKERLDAAFKGQLEALVTTRERNTWTRYS